MKKEVMKKAWKIRKAAAKIWNCNVSEIEFSVCLRNAWKAVKYNKSTEYNVVTCNGQNACGFLINDKPFSIDNGKEQLTLAALMGHKIIKGRNVLNRSFVA